MKRIIAFFSIFILLLSSVPNTAAYAYALNGDVFIDFENYTGSAGIYDTYCQLGAAFDAGAPENDSSHGTSVRVFNKNYGSDAYINYRTTFSTNAVMGFSFFTNDSNAGFSISTKGTSNKWDDSAIIGLLVFTGASIKMKGVDEPIYSGSIGKWIDLAIAFDLEDHEALIYVDGEHVGTYILKDAVVDIDYFNMGFQKDRYTDSDVDNTDYASIYLDDFFAYYPDMKISSDVISEEFDSSVESVFFSLNQNAIMINNSTSVSLNGESIEYEAICEKGFMRGFKIKNWKFMPNMEYIVELAGIKDLLGNDVTAEYSFKLAVKEPEIELTYTDDGILYPEGTKIKIGVKASNINGAPIDIYNNDEQICSLISECEEFYVILNGGENIIYASADVAGFDTKYSNSITKIAYDYNVVDELGYIDFSNDQIGYVASNSTDVANNEVKYITDEETGNRYIYAKNLTGSSFGLNFLYNSSNPEYKGSYVYEFDFMSPDPSKINNNFLGRRMWHSKDDGSEGYLSEWVMPHNKFINADGKITGTDYKIDAGKWYRIKLLYDFHTQGNKTMYIFVNDEPVISYKLSMQNVTNENYGRHAVSELGSEFCLDNIHGYYIAKPYSAEIDLSDYDSQKVPYENAIVTLVFDSDMDVSTLNNVKLIDGDGSAMIVKFSSVDSAMKTFRAIIPKLKANCKYTIDLSNVKSTVGASSELKSELWFKTEKMPFCIDEVTETFNGNKVNLNVSIRNANNEEKSYIVLAGLFIDNMMIEADVKKLQSSSSENLFFEYAKPNSKYEIRVCVYDSIEKLNYIDKYSFDGSKK